MCANMKEFQTVSEKIFELEQKKAKKKKEVDALEKEIKQLKSETSSYMKLPDYCFSRLDTAHRYIALSL